MKASVGKLDVSVGKIVRDNLTLTVELHATGIRWFRFRLWIGTRILKLASASSAAALK